MNPLEIARRDHPPPEPTAGDARQRWAQLVAAAVVVGVALYVMRPFLAPIAWAAILAYASWPLYQRVERMLGRRPTLAASFMTLLIVLGILVPAGLLSVALAAEVQRTFAGTRLNLATLPDSVMAWATALPLVGPELAARLGDVLADTQAAERWVLARLGSWAATVTSLAGDLGRLLLEAVVALVTAFTLYRHGHAVGAQVQAVMRRWGGERLVAMLTPLGATVRAVTYGTLLTAATQGMLVMLGCWAAGLKAPVLLGALAGLLSLTPIGSPLVYVPACIWLGVQGRYVAAGLLLAWGVLVVGSVDNVIRSWFLSGAVRIPFLLGFFGLLGGIAAFGAIGLFIGPVSVALVLTLWREWAAGPPPDAPAGEPSHLG